MRESTLVLRFVVILLASFAAAVGYGDQVKVDPAEGFINGKVAVTFLPSKAWGADNLLDPDGYDVHLAPLSGDDVEFVYPAGSWLLPPPDKYKYWLEGPESISPFSSIVTYGGQKSKKKGMVCVAPVVPAGLVASPPGVELAPQINLRLMHLESHNLWIYPRREMSRRVASKVAGKGVLMPEGQIVAALYDRKKGEYSAISRPLEVSRKRVTYVHPEPPTSSTDLIVRLERPVILERHEQYDVEFHLVGLGNDPRRPDVVIPTADRIYGIWYGLRGRYATLEVKSPSVYLAPHDIVLRSGKVEFYQALLRKLPSLDVQFFLPPELPLKAATLAVHLARPSRDLIRITELPPATEQYRLESLPAGKLELVLRIPPWGFHERVDLSAGLDSTTLFQPQLLMVSGRVYRGEEEHPATVAFRVYEIGDNVEIETDGSGFYKTLLFQPG
ncbi:MAG: hypothetical protein GY835_19810, partial [bacterium]|nr:hypothetical protein [bacterium]